MKSRDQDPRGGKDGHPSRPRRVLFFIGMVLVLALILWGAYSSMSLPQTEPEENAVLTVNGTNVYAEEVSVYWRLMRLHYEDVLGQDVWDQGLMGVDTDQAATDQVMDSIVRVKVVQNERYRGTPPSDEAVALRVEKLRQVLGEDFLTRYQIPDELLDKIVRENYKAYAYEHNANFLLSDYEAEVEQSMQDTFGPYENTDYQVAYLATAVVRPLMFYTGQWADDEWVSYPDVQKEQILKQAQAVHDNLTDDNLDTMAQAFADDTSCVTIPVFNRGFILNPHRENGRLYRGQIEKSVADVIFSLSRGQISDVIETEYGYLIVQVTDFSTMDVEDMKEYSRQLANARKTYRENVVEELKEKRLNEELDRLISQSDIKIHEERFFAYLETIGAPASSSSPADTK